jgi:hypothetical protein
VASRLYNRGRDMFKYTVCNYGIVKMKSTYIVNVGKEEKSTIRIQMVIKIKISIKNNSLQRLSAFCRRSKKLQK